MLAVEGGDGAHDGDGDAVVTVALCLDFYQVLTSAFSFLLLTHDSRLTPLLVSTPLHPILYLTPRPRPLTSATWPRRRWSCYPL